MTSQADMVMQEMDGSGGEGAAALALGALARRAWALFRAEAARGRFRRRVLFWTIDLADEFAQVMAWIFGPEPSAP